MDVAMAYGLPQHAHRRTSSSLSSAMWSSSHDLLQPLIFCPQESHSRKAFISVIRSADGFPSPSSALRQQICHEFTPTYLASPWTAEKWVCYGGGKRPRKPRIWKTRQRRGSLNKSDKLLECIESLSNVKEELYGALDAFIAWELDFPLIAVKKALYALQMRKDWPRVIQVTKWMLGKGQGRSLGTYHLLLRAFSEEGRIDEAQELWKKVFSRQLECTPMKLFVEVMRMYKRYNMHDNILDVFADMEELDVKLNLELVDIVSETYEKLGIMNKAEKVRVKYQPPRFRWRTIEGRRVKFRIWPSRLAFPEGVSRWIRGENSDSANAVHCSKDSAESEDEEGYASVEDDDNIKDFGDLSISEDEEFQEDRDAGEFQVDGDFQEDDYRVPVRPRQTIGNNVYV